MKSSLYPNRFFVIIPCYNCEEYINNCLESLQAQTFTGWSALVADDCSTDRTAKIAAQYAARDKRISIHTGSQRAWLMGNTLNALRSLNLTPSDVVAILDGDDLIRPACLERLWEKHRNGFDLVYTDEDIQGQKHSIGADLLTSVPVRQQSWRFSQLRSFKAYLFSLLEDADFRDANGGYFRAAGDLALYLPMAELVGPEKVHFIQEKLYYYRVHENCNFKIFRQEQLENNWLIRSRPILNRQNIYFDYSETLSKLDKGGLTKLGAEIRARFPQPHSIEIKHLIKQDDKDSWRAYHNLWIEEGVFLKGIIQK